MIDRLKRLLKIGANGIDTSDRIAWVDREVAAHRESAADLRHVVRVRPDDDARRPGLLDSPLLPRRDRDERRVRQ